jgi:two-component system response regulator YesN
MKKICPSADYAVISSTDVACLLHLDTGAVPEQLGLLIAETGEMVKKFNNLTISAAAGSVVNSIFVINDSFEEAREILKERFFSGAETLIIRTSGAVRGETQFPERIMEELNSAVISGAVRQITDSVGKLSVDLKKTSYEYAHMHLNTAVMQLLSFCLVNKLPVDANSFHAVNSKIQGLETLQKACEILREFCLSLVNSISKNPGETLPPIVRDAVKLAEEKFGDPAFSINTAAAIFNITPAYFNRVFKKFKQTSYSEFLNEYRMERACAMLLETNEPVNTIANSIGISNATYFYTLFKKIYNCTPQQFRNRSKR